MAVYPYVPAWYDNYGPRKGPALGLMYHMAEGGGTVGYLDKHGQAPPRGVSVHTVCEYSGRVVQMVPWAEASGSLNPNSVSSDKAYYGHKHLVSVLGNWWKDPNSAVLSMEIEGFAKNGPNPAQVVGAIAWGQDMRTRYASLVGALGHADQTDEKNCPGMTPAMRSIFDGVGGHGLWVPDTAVGDTVNSYAVPKVPTQAFIARGEVLYTSDACDPKDPKRIIVDPGRNMPYLGNPSPTVSIVEYVDDKGVHSGTSYFVHPATIGAQTPIQSADCTAAVTAATAPLNARIASMKSKTLTFAADIADE